GLLLDALAGLPRGLRDRLLVHVFTSKVDELAESVGDAGLADVVRVNPYVPYLEFLHLADRMDVLLVNDAVTPPGGTVNPFLRSGLLLDALAGLPRGLRDRLLVHVFTSKVDELAESVGDAGLADVVRVNPYVPYLEFLNLADRMDVLLVNDAVTPPGGTVNPFLPSKWSDYRGSSTPVWAIVEEGSSLSRMEGIRF